MAEEVTAAGSWMTPIDDPYLPIHYPTTNLLPFLQGDERWVSVSTAQTAETDDFLLVGEAIGRADRAQRPARRAAGQRGDEPHVLEAARSCAPTSRPTPPHPHAGGPPADLERLAWLEAGDHAGVIDTMPEFLRHRPEGMFGHYLMMVGGDRRPGLRGPRRRLQRLRERHRHRPGPRLVRAPHCRSDPLITPSKLRRSSPPGSAGSSGRCGSRGRSRRPLGRCPRCRCRRRAP